jgi:hypothetical protein
MPRPKLNEERLLLRLSLRRKMKLEAHALDVEKTMTQVINDYIDKLQQPTSESMNIIEEKYASKHKPIRKLKLRKIESEKVKEANRNRKVKPEQSN